MQPHIGAERIKSVREHIGKALVTGAEGFLAGRILMKYDMNGIGRSEADIASLSQVDRAVRKYQPDTIIHCAAVSDTREAEQNKEKAYQINVLGAENVAKVCKEYGIKLVHMSSDQIYNGNSSLEAFSETAAVSPVSEYGKQKQEAEQRILNILPQSICLRLTWMYDFPVRAKKTNTNFICQMLKAMLKEEKQMYPVYEYRGITNVWEIVHNLDKILTLPGGIYNAGSENDKNMYETAKQAAKLLGVPKQKAEKLICPDTVRFEAHPRNLRISNLKLQNHGIFFHTAVKGMEECLKDYDMLGKDISYGCKS